jgi:2-C-methyl-D-erythritol 2,4-cyclodiphosphate synthase
MDIRVGQGYDVHRLGIDRPLILGGVEIDHPLGLLGHSDADVVLHAVIDALLGAAALGDIGRHFPDNDLTYKGADSKILLHEAYTKVKEAGWILVNLDVTIIAQKPKLAPFIPKMCDKMAEILHLPSHLINIKAKTNEHLGYLGREEAIEAQAICLLKNTQSISYHP